METLAEKLNETPGLTKDKQIRLLSNGQFPPVGDSDWLQWEFPLEFSSRGRNPTLKDLGIETNSITIDDVNNHRRAEISGPKRGTMKVRLRIAVNRNGDFQLGTIGSGNVHEHLLLLAQFHSGLNTHFDWKDSPGSKLVGRNRILSLDELGPSKFHFSGDPFLKLNERQVLLSEYAVNLFRMFQNNSWIENNSSTPQNMADIVRQCKFELHNNFDEPITIVMGVFKSASYRDSLADSPKKGALPLFDDEKRTMIARTKRLNERWSAMYDRRVPLIDDLGLPPEEMPKEHLHTRDFNNPKPTDPSKGTWEPPSDDASREYAKITWTIPFDLPKDLPTAFTFWLQTDNRNASRMTIRGLNRPIDYRNLSLTGSGEFNVATIDNWKDRFSFRATQNNISGVECQLYDVHFEEIEYTALWHWSTTSPTFKLAVLGSLDDSQIAKLKQPAPAIAEVFNVYNANPPKGDQQNRILRPDWNRDDGVPIDTVRRSIPLEVWTIPSSKQRSD